MRPPQGLELEKKRKPLIFKNKTSINRGEGVFILQVPNTGKHRENISLETGVKKILKREKKKET